MPTMEERLTMQLLKIDESHQALFYKNGSYANVVDIERDDLVSLVELAAKNEPIQLDECTEENNIVNPIAKTIYTQLYSALQDLSENRDTYIQKYKEELGNLKKGYGISPNDPE